MASPRYPREDNRMITSAHASSSVSWSINIPQLADLVLRLGAEGLKRLQLSGVDVHTVGCILALGEITPASVEYRSRLQKTRENQRAKTWWIHNTIQYGTGVNFVVDELLKTRAGENVLALITATSSVLEGSDLEFFNLLYNKYDPGMQNTPSVAQLERLRAICLPLARAMDFKDRLAEIHSWLVTQTTAKGVSYVRLESAVPTMTTLVQLVEILKDISTQDLQQRSRLAFYGVRGAAWLILYAKSILGLSVCMVFSNGQTVPLSGDFKTASVLIFPQASETADVFKNIGKASDVIVLTSDESRTLSTNWLLSCDVNGVDIFALMCRWNMKHRQEIGDLIFSIAAEYVERRVSMGESRFLIRYHAQDLVSKLDALRQILHLLGLPDQLSRHQDWRDTHFQNLLVEGQQRFELNLRQFSTMLRGSGEESYPFCSHVMIQPPEIDTAFSICVRCHLSDVVREMAFFSCSLVFSDWHLSLRKISHRRISTGGDSLSQEAYRFFSEVYADYDRQCSPQSFCLDHIHLAKHLAAICSGSLHSEDLIQSNRHKFLGLDIDGVLLITYRAVDQSLRSGPVFLLREGEFSLHGEQRPLLIASLQHGSSSFGCEIENTSELKPFNHFMDAKLALNASLQRDAIKMQYNFSFEGENENGDLISLEVDIPVSDISDGLQALYTTPSCPHGYGAPLKGTQVHINDEDPRSSRGSSYWQDLDGSLWQICGTLTCDLKDPSTSTLPPKVNYLFPVENNPIAEWASVAMAWHRSKNLSTTRTVLLLQQRACLSCSRAYADKLIVQGSGERQDLFVISAGEI